MRALINGKDDVMNTIRLNNILNDVLKVGPEEPDLSHLYSCIKSESLKKKDSNILYILLLSEEHAFAQLETEDLKRIFRNDIAKRFLIKALSDYDDISNRQDMYHCAVVYLYQAAQKRKNIILAHIMSTHLKDHVFRFSCDDEKTSKELSKTLTDKTYDMILNSPLDYFSTYYKIVEYLDNRIQDILNEVKSAFPFCKVEYGQSLKATIHSVTPGPTNVGTCYKVRL